MSRHRSTNWVCDLCGQTVIVAPAPYEPVWSPSGWAAVTWPGIDSIGNVSDFCADCTELLREWFRETREVRQDS
jgi:hypothetical protein